MEISPPSYNYLNASWLTGHGGSIAAVLNNHLTFSPISLSTFISYEIVTFLKSFIVPLLKYEFSQ